MGGWTVGRMDVWMDGLMDGWRVGSLGSQIGSVGVRDPFKTCCLGSLAARV